MGEILVIDGEEMMNISSPLEFIDRIGEAFQQFSLGRTIRPDRTVMWVKGNWWGVMPGYIPGQGVAVKIVSVNPRNRLRNLPTIPGAVILLDEDTGLPLALMDGSVLTGLRTAAASALSVKLLAPDSGGVVSIFGAGYQARFHIKFISEVYRVEKLYVYDINRDAAINFVAYASDLGLDIVYSSESRNALSKSDILVETSTTERPVILGEYIKDRVHIVSIGAHTPDSRAIDDEAIRRADVIVVDSRDATYNETGDIREPVDNGIIKLEDIIEIGEIYGGIKRIDRGEIGVSIYKSVGLSIQDVSAARYIFEKASETGVGSRVRV